MGQLVALRNMKNGVTVLTPVPSDPKSFLEFQAHGDPAGGDVQYISAEAAATPATAAAIVSGVFELEDDTNSEITEAFERQIRIARQQQERAARAVAATIDRPENHDLVGVACVGPGTVPGRACGDHLPIREVNLSEQPPLCARHAHLSGQFVPVMDRKDDEEVTRWLPTVITEREREQR